MSILAALVEIYTSITVDYTSSNNIYSCVGNIIYACTNTCTCMCIIGV